MKVEKTIPLKRSLALLCSCLLMLCFISCSSQSNEPNPATPEGRFELAKKEFAAAQFDKALGYTAKILRDTPNHELAGSAAILEMTISGGLAEGFRQVGKAYAEGQMITRDVRLRKDFHNTAFDVYRRQKVRALDFLEVFEAYYKKMDKTKPVVFQGVYPQTEAAPRIFLEKVSKGMAVAEEDSLRDVEQELKNGVLTVLTELAGLGEDRAKAKAVFASGTVSVDSGDFLFAVAKILHEQDVLFDQFQLNELNNFKVFCERTNATVKESIDLMKPRGDKKKLDAASKLQKDCESMMKKFKK
jgi:hypothetical protein